MLIGMNQLVYELSFSLYYYKCRASRKKNKVQYFTFITYNLLKLFSIKLNNYLFINLLIFTLTQYL